MTCFKQFLKQTGDQVVRIKLLHFLCGCLVGKYLLHDLEVVVLEVLEIGLLARSLFGLRIVHLDDVKQIKQALNVLLPVEKLCEYQAGLHLADESNVAIAFIARCVDHPALDK